MLNNSRFIICLAVIFSFLSFTVLAQETESLSQSNRLEVRDVLIDKIDENAVTARDKAIIEARRVAFKMLAERVMGAEDFLDYKLPDDALIARLVRDFEIKDEKLSTNRYMANFTVRFDDKALNFLENGSSFFGKSSFSRKKLLSDYKFRAGDKSRTILLLPYYKNFFGRNILWEDPNPWRDDWQTFGGVRISSKVSIIVPTGDIEDISFGSSEAVWDGDYTVLEKIRKNYKADEVMIATAYKNDTNVDIDIYIYKNGLFEHKKSIASYIAEDSFKKPIQDVIASNELFNEVVFVKESSASSLNDKKIELEIKMFFSNFRDWVDAQKRMVSISPKPDFDILSLNKDAVTFKIDVKSEEDFKNLKSSFYDKGLYLVASDFNADGYQNDTEALKYNYILRLK